MQTRCIISMRVSILEYPRTDCDQLQVVQRVYIHQDTHECIIWDVQTMQVNGKKLQHKGPIFTKGLSQGLGLKLRLLSQVSAQKLLRLLS